MKKKLSILFALVLAVSLMLVPAAPAAGADYTILKTDAEYGEQHPIYPAIYESRIVVNVPAGTTLGEIETISWDELLVEGYPPHVDIILDMGEGITDALVIEYAYNEESHAGEGQITPPTSYGALVGGPYATFSDDGDGPAVIDFADGTANAWLTSQEPGALTFEEDPGATYGALPAGFYYTTIAEWVVGDYVIGINGDTPVLRLEIEVDNWILECEAHVSNIQVKIDGTTVVGLNAIIPSVVAISVGPTSIDFGTITPGTAAPGGDITVENIGTVTVAVNAYLDPTGGVFDFLSLNSNSGTGGAWTPGDLAMSDMDPTAVETCATVLDVPETYSAKGTETATLIFIATASP